MTIENHSLVNELPEFKQRIHDLKMNDMHFHRLFNEYHDVDKEVHSIESGAQVSSDEFIEGLKKKRLNLKDQLFSILNAETA